MRSTSVSREQSLVQEGDLDRDMATQCDWGYREGRKAVGTLRKEGLIQEPHKGRASRSEF